MRDMPLATGAASAAAIGDPRQRRMRPKIWELPATCHCITIGTCLTLGELRRVAVRLDLFAHAQAMTDYELHSAFVHAMDTRNRASAALQKLLESNHEGAIRRTGRLSTEAELAAFWDEASGEGQIAGAFWALLTHVKLTPALEKRMFGEVHMMSHLCGASHRADQRAVALVARQRSAIAHRMEQATAGHQAALAARDSEIERLKRLVTGLEAMVHDGQRLREENAALKRGDELASLRRALDEASARGDQAARRQQAAEAEATRLALRVRELEDQADVLIDRLVELEGVVRGQEGAGGPVCPVRLDGRCIAYIGGRPQTVSRIRHFVERCNGCLLHHDGGPEQSTQALEGILSRADFVVFPTDCVSHGAVEKLKTVCERRKKAFAPLPSSSFSAFAAIIGKASTAPAGGLKDGG